MYLFMIPFNFDVFFIYYLSSGEYNDQNKLYHQLVSFGFCKGIVVGYHYGI